MSKPLIPMPDTEKGRAYQKALALIDEACQITENYGKMTAQVLVMQLVSRAISQKIPKKTVIQIVEQTYDWAEKMKGLSAEEIIKSIFGKA